MILPTIATGGWHSRPSTKRDSTRIDLGATYTSGEAPSLPPPQPLSCLLPNCPVVPLHAGKSGKQIERCVIASFQIAESMGFQGEFRQWEELLRIDD